MGPAAAARLARLGIVSARGLLEHVPRRYIDRSAVLPIASVKDGAWVTLVGVVEKTKVQPSRRSGLYIAEAMLRDHSGRIGLVWFFQGAKAKRYARTPVREGQRIAVSGTVKWSPQGPKIATPQWEELPRPLGPGEGLAPIPVYPLTQGLNQGQLRRWIGWLLDNRPLRDPLPEALLRRLDLVPLHVAYTSVHRPQNLTDVEAGRRRLAFDELLSMQLAVQQAAAEREAMRAPVCPRDVLSPRAYAVRLPFTLTSSQEKAIERCSDLLEQPRATAALLQGDVGSGKTVVAAYAAARAVLAGYQAALMAPTKLLAEQHHKNLTGLLKPWGIQPDLLLSETSKAHREELIRRLAQGEPALVVGTHALLSPEVVMSRFAVGIIDEQHRFGVKDRESFAQKGGGHLLTMSATPIPRTLALTLYGDLEVIVLDEKPPGRRPVDTRWIHPKDREKVYAFLRREIERGRQAYVVFPRVFAVEDEDEGEEAAVAQAEKLARDWLRGLSVGLIHGQMTPSEQEEAMAGFVSGQIQVLVASTVVEVGVDVPNASVMVIEGADRFGLAQLHQLRGRVGRGDHPSYCLLLADPQSERAKRRIDALRKTDDGFLIAEMDLALRGPGEFAGVRQAGPFSFRHAEFPRDLDLLQAAKDEARAFLAAGEAGRERTSLSAAVDRARSQDAAAHRGPTGGD